MRKYRILELVITRDQTRNALHAPSRSLQESPQEGTAGTEPTFSLTQISLKILIQMSYQNLRIKHQIINEAANYTKLKLFQDIVRKMFNLLVEF
jgi:hypothetical protein